MKLCVMALGAALVILASSSQASAQSGQGKGAQGPAPVIVMPAYKDQFVDRIEAIGTLRANESITLASTVTQTVTSVNFEDGQRVSKGDILVEITDAEEKALLDQQQALVKEAERQLTRAKELAKSGAAASSVLDERQRDYSSAKAALAALQSRLRDHIIVAPFDGVVGLRNISVGALLQPGTKITTLDDDSVMKLDFSVPSIYLSTLKVGLAIEAKAAGYTETFKGEIVAIDSQIDEVSRSVTVRATIPNPDGRLKPGLLMSVTLLKNPRESIGVPEAAIVPEGTKKFIYVVGTDNKAEKREIQTGTRREGDIEVTGNLKEGEKVVTQGTMLIRDGAAVTVNGEQKRGETVEALLKRLKQEKGGQQSGEKPKDNGKGENKDESNTKAAKDGEGK